MNSLSYRNYTLLESITSPRVIVSMYTYTLLTELKISTIIHKFLNPTNRYMTRRVFTWRSNNEVAPH
jgi:hypothetical protein